MRSFSISVCYFQNIYYNCNAPQFWQFWQFLLAKSLRFDLSTDSTLKGIRDATKGKLKCP